MPECMSGTEFFASFPSKIQSIRFHTAFKLAFIIGCLISSAVLYSRLLPLSFYLSSRLIMFIAVFVACGIGILNSTITLYLFCLPNHTSIFLKNPTVYEAVVLILDLPLLASFGISIYWAANTSGLFKTLSIIFGVLALLAFVTSCHCEVIMKNVWNSAFLRPVQTNALRIHQYPQHSGYSNAAVTVPSPPYPEANHYPSPSGPPAYPGDMDKLVDS